MNSEDRGRVSMVAMAGGPALAVLAAVAEMPPRVWLLLAAVGAAAAWYRWDGRHHRSLAEEVEAAFPDNRWVRAEERGLPGGLLLVLVPSPPLTDPQLRAALAGPVAAHGYKIVSIRQAKRGRVTVTLVELVPV
jgi:hypothetical protein